MTPRIQRFLIAAAMDIAIVFAMRAAGADWWSAVVVLYGHWCYHDGRTRRWAGRKV